ncbi:MAG: HDOD domain-containing protein [Candidatus Cloacimonadota bacterium]|nr:HDOD domain-containing protein [Candidatus Cloacimonadota bacterium]
MPIRVRKVLFVDDDPQVIKSLKRSMLDAEFSTVFLESATEALEFLKESKVDLVVSDMLMPKMDGYKFLDIVSNNYPDIMRFALSATTNEENVKICLVMGVAENFLVKPWKEEDLRGNIRTALALKEDLEDNRMADLMSNVKRFPVLPSTYYDVMKAIRSNQNAKTLADIIEKDATFAADVMKVSNSAFYFHGKETTSVQMAIVFLGIRTLRSILVNISVYKLLQMGSTSPLEARFLWDHSAYVNELLFFIYKKLTNHTLPENYHSAGLLHDMGKFFLMNALPDKYKQITDKLKNDENMNWVQAENMVMDVPHTKLGSFLLRTWNFSQKLQEVCMYHHDPLNSPVSDEAKRVMAIMKIADMLSWIMLKDANIPDVSDEVFEYLNLSQSDIQMLLKDFINTKKGGIAQIPKIISR